MKTLYTLVVFFMFIGTSLADSPSQDTISSIDRRYYEAEEFIYHGNYEGAIKIYESIFVETPEDPVLNFYLGYCYLHTTDQKEKATKYLYRAVEYQAPPPTPGVEIKDEGKRQRRLMKFAKGEVLDSVPIEAEYYLAKAYHVNYKFEEAAETYDHLLTRLETNTTLKRKEKEEARVNIEYERQLCYNGIEVMKNPVKMEVINLDTLNSPYSEHSPVVSADENTIIYTSKRGSGDEENAKQTRDLQYYEDIFIAKKEDGEWQESKPIENVNSEGHDASISMTTDGKELYIYRADNRGGDVFYSKLENNSWTTPVKLGKNINSRKRETHASISADGQALYFTSDRKKAGVWPFRKRITEGGMDIFVSKKLPDGTWGEAKNLGPRVNTKYDEASPFIHPDGTLYFSSKGHKTIGGFDIFASKKLDDGTWDEAQNIGYPINTTGDDIFYVVSANGINAYYASNQPKDNKGKSDLFMIGFADDNINNLAVYEGEVAYCDDRPPADIKVTITDVETGDLVGIYTPHPQTGKFVTLLAPESNYKFAYEPGDDEYEAHYDSSLIVEYKNIYKNVRKPVVLNAVEVCKPQVAEPVGFVVANIRFGLDSTIIDESKNPNVFNNLDRFAEYMIKFPDCEIIIHGHTCEIGTASYNMNLSNRRAETVKKYLVKKGIEEERIKIESHGLTEPIAVNRNPDGTWKTGSLEWNRRIEFEVVKPGEAQIKVRQLEVPAQYRINRAQ